MVERRRKNIFIPIVAEFCNIHIRASESGNIHRSSRLDIRICFVGNIIVFVSSFLPFLGHRHIQAIFSGRWHCLHHTTVCTYSSRCFIVGWNDGIPLSSSVVNCSLWTPARKLWWLRGVSVRAGP